MKFILTGQTGYRNRQQFYKTFEEESHEAALATAHKLVIEELGGEDSEFLEAELDDVSHVKLRLVESETDLDKNHPNLVELLVEAQADERKKRNIWAREQDERELARLTERLKS